MLDSGVSVLTWCAFCRFSRLTTAHRSQYRLLPLASPFIGTPQHVQDAPRRLPDFLASTLQALQATVRCPADPTLILKLVRGLYCLQCGQLLMVSDSHVRQTLCLLVANPTKSESSPHWLHTMSSVGALILAILNCMYGVILCNRRMPTFRLGRPHQTT